MGESAPNVIGGTPSKAYTLDAPDGKGEWDAENDVSPGEPNDDEEEPERECAWGSYSVTAGEMYSGSSSSRILCSNRTMFSRSS